MVDTDDFVRAGRRRPSFRKPAKPYEFEFGPYHVYVMVHWERPSLRKPPSTRSRFDVVERASGAIVTCDVERSGMPTGTELLRGIAGTLDGEPIEFRRYGKKLWRRDRVVFVSGAIDLRLDYQDPETTIRRGHEPDGDLLWTSESQGMLVRDATHREAAAVAAIVLNGIDQAGTPLRIFLYF